MLDNTFPMIQSDTASFLQTKKHFQILDGMRGIAALAVVVFHYLEWIYPDPSQNFIGHGFLAVDFFFCLSGFVIAYAYDGRLSQMGLGAFFTARLIRLHPLVIAGTVLGMMGLLLDPFADHAAAYSFGMLALIFACGLFMIPLPIMEERAFNLFSLNAPSWSLFWEYVANILYALVLVRLSRRVLLILLVPAAAAILWVSYGAGNLLGGWSGGTFMDGGVRMGYSFLAGMLIYRFDWVIKSKLGFISLSLLLFAAFLMPSTSQNWLVESLLVLLYFPFLIAVGAGAQVSGWLEKVCAWLGKISYPLYMTHYAAIWCFGNYFVTQNPSKEALAWIIPLGTLVMVAFAWLVMILFDEPVRRYLTKKRKAKLETVS